MKKTLLALLLLATCCAWGAPRKGYKLTLTIADNHDSVMYLGNYYAGQTYAFDTARVDKKGRFVFEHKSRSLLPGLYFFTNPRGNYVEFIVFHEEPYFTFETAEAQWTLNMQVKGSAQNELFYRYHHINRKYYDIIDSAQRAKTDDDAFASFRRSMLLELDSIKESLIDANPDNLLSIMMSATREPNVPKYDSQGNKLSDKERFDYYASHYFDAMSLNEDAIVRTPDMVFHKRVMDYLDVTLKGASAEMLCHYIDMMLDKARPSRETFRYLVHTITEKYLQSNIMSYDAVYVHMVQKYYASGEAFWSSPATIDEQVTRANKWEKLLVGKTAPELILKDRAGAAYSMHYLQSAYTLLVFWSPACGHCKVMIPELYDKFKKYASQADITAFTILSEPDEATRPKWNEFIDKHDLNDPRWLNLDGGEANIDWHDVYDVETTPQIYLLDKDKKIIAKKLNAESFAMIMDILLEADGKKEASQ
ncbi:MAG: DUF5106 domain-containing protein [Bacteroidales bacterium]|nr:DUF5106 domain-containing protein [Bacteroidales bacterium]